MTKEITVSALIENVADITEFAENEMMLHDCSMKTVMQINIAIDEIFSNIVKFAYPDSTGNATVSIEFKENPNMIVMQFIDSGVPYNPLEREDPDVSLSADDREIGGLGIFVVKKSMDEVTYSYENNQNILTLFKKY